MRQSLRYVLFLAAAAGAAPAAAEGVLDRLKETGEIRIGVRSDAAPLSYTDKDGKPAGFSVLVCDAVAAALGKAVGHDPLTVTPTVVGTDDRFDSGIRAARSTCSAAPTPSRSIAASRSTSRSRSSSTAPRCCSAAIRRPNLDALAGKKIGVRAGTTTEEAVRGTLAAKKMQADVVTFASHPDGLTALEDERDRRLLRRPVDPLQPLLPERCESRPGDLRQHADRRDPGHRPAARRRRLPPRGRHARSASSTAPARWRHSSSRPSPAPPPASRSRRCS